MGIVQRGGVTDITQERQKKREKVLQLRLTDVVPRREEVFLGGTFILN